MQDEVTMADTEGYASLRFSTFEIEKSQELSLRTVNQPPYVLKNLLDNKDNAVVIISDKYWLSLHKINTFKGGAELDLFQDEVLEIIDVSAHPCLLNMEIGS